MERPEESRRDPPLSGVRVVDLSRLFPGPLCSLLLADYGAEVIKVEDLGPGDYMRWAPPRYEGEDDSVRAAMFVGVNANKRSVRLNLKEEGGREALLRLAAGADVLLESFRPGVMDRLGLGYEDLRARNEGLIYCAISGYGATGPERLTAGHDLNYLAASGLLGVSGEAGGAPSVSATQIADVGGGSLMATIGILMALRAREASGSGQFVDVSMLDGVLGWMPALAAHLFAGQRSPARGEIELGGRLICYRPYECEDGWVSLAALETKFWEAFIGGVERPDLLGNQFDPPGSPAHSELVQIFAGRGRDQWQEFSERHECCMRVILDLDEALDSALVREREMVVSFDQPGIGEVRRMGLPIKLSRTPGDATRLPAPALGADTVPVLRECGYEEAEIEALIAVGAAGARADGRRGDYLGD